MTFVAAPLLAYFQRGVVSHAVIAIWLSYTLVLAALRILLTYSYVQARRHGGLARGHRDHGWWNRAFAAGSALAGLGWGAAGIFLYPQATQGNQIFLVFVLGGMMLGGAALLAPRRESFLAFLLPTGLLPAMRLLASGDAEHVAMALLTFIFTAATVATTWRFHLTVASSLRLKFENQHLVEDLRAAKEQTDELNRDLERRVEARTAELQQSTERLRTEMRNRERMEEELLRQRKLESLGVLAGGIAHDLNNFLTVVQGSIDLIKMRLPPRDAINEELDRTAAACERAVQLSSQLLTFSKGGTPVRRVTSMQKLIADAAQLARAGAAVSIDVDVAPDLWAAEVDAGQMSQVLQNILLNAKQATAAGGVVHVRAANIKQEDDNGGGSRVRIAITDHGGGMTPDVLPRIFDPYFTTKHYGSGLGLATAYAIVSKHKGRLSVESTEGEGSTFTIDLPASPAMPAEESPAGVCLQVGTGRLLVMDDEASIRALLVQVLRRLGYEVESAKEGGEAVALYEAARIAGREFDAVLLDLTVRGGMGGVEAAAKLKQLDPFVKIIASSGYSDAPVMSGFRDYGFVDVLPKPWGAAQLSEVFRRVLANGIVADPPPVRDAVTKPGDAASGNLPS